MNNLGADGSGNVIENKRGNKGQFIADFKQAIRPEHPEFLVVFFNRREPLCVPTIGNCNPSPGYPAQTYGSCDDVCDGTVLVPPEDD